MTAVDYIQKIEKFLQAHQIVVRSVKERRVPPMSISGQRPEGEWLVRDFEIHTLQVGKRLVPVWRWLDTNTTKVAPDNIAWHDAFEIQSEFYRYLNRNPDTAYWRLWDYISTR